MSKFDTDPQKWFNKLIDYKVLNNLPYVEWGDSFTIFRDPATNKLFEVRLKEIKPKKKLKEL